MLVEVCTVWKHSVPGGSSATCLTSIALLCIRIRFLATCTRGKGMVRERAKKVKQKQKTLTDPGENQFKFRVSKKNSFFNCYIKYIVFYLF